MTIEEKGQAMLEGIAAIREKRKQGELLLLELEEQALLMCQGIDPQEIEKAWYDYRHDPACKDAYETRTHREALTRSANLYNVVTMKDGSVRVLKEPIASRSKKP